MLFALTFVAALTSGLIAGVFFAFSAFVMAALGRLPTVQGIAAMQSINRVVLNPCFLAPFLGAGVAGLLLTLAALAIWRQPGAPWLLGGGLLYLGGTLLVTLRCNVPLNRMLAAVEPDSAEGAALWRRYLARWTAWNHLRTAAALASAAAFTVALNYLKPF